MTMRRLVLSIPLLFAATAFAQVDPAPRQAVIKPARATVQAWHEPSVICVKLADGKRIGDARDELDAALAGGAWGRFFDTPDDRLAAYRDRARGALRKQVADLGAYYAVTLPAGTDAAAAIDALNALDVVEIAEPMPRPVRAPVPGSFTNSQGYAHGGPNGTDAFASWGVFGFRGEGVRVCDIEYSFNPNHLDLPDIGVIGPIGTDPFNDNNHGTATIGEMGALDNGFGTTGMAPDAEYYFAAALAGTYNPGAAIIRSLDVLGPGDAILIEQQIGGPNGDFVPIEWFAPYYNAIVTATGNGVTVVEAAGNGGENLDAPEFSTGNGGHWPFLPENDSGAIIVGAGAPGTSGTPRSRLGFSTFGSTVDLQGWGSGVTTTGYGSLYSTEGQNLWYTGSFNGTSSASPIVTGAVALLQSTYMNLTGIPLTPMEVRDILRATGSPQTGNTSQNIGPLPNVPEAIALALGDAEALLPLEDDFESGAIDILNWTGALDAFVTDEAANEPSGVFSVKLLGTTGQLLSARLRARLFDDITVGYAHQIEGTGEFVVEWFDTETGFTEIARHTGEGSNPSTFTSESVVLPASASIDGLRVRFRHVAGTGDAFLDDVGVEGAPALPRPFEMLTPLDGATEQGLRPEFDWSPSELQDEYRLIVDDNPDFSSPELDVTTQFSGFSNPAQVFDDETLYFWKVEALNANGATLASGGTDGVRTFSTFGFTPECPGDCSNNGTVDFDDLVCTLFRFGQSGHGPRIDCDQNGAVDFNDLICVLFAFGPCPVE
ncbi:MAG: S8 family peptidase [Phycisphaerales bacterium]